MLARSIIRVGIIAVSAAWLLNPIMADAECVSVVGPAAASSSGVRITVRLDGKAQGSAKVEGFLTGNIEQSEFSVFTDDDGIAILPTLAPGYYHIVATGRQTLRADLIFVVPPDGRGSASAFSMDLKQMWGQYDLSAAEKKAPSERLPDFAGIIIDPSGAGIPGAKIAVWKQGVVNGAPAVELASDHVGRFSTHLEDGTYIAVFDEPGFRGQIIIFEVTKTNARQALEVSLQIAAC
jgi:hypothetical protein